MAKRLLKNLTDDYLVCRICLDKYTEPRRLPCEHIFCRQCLQNHISQRTLQSGNDVLFPCPICRKEIIAQREHFSSEDLADYFPSDSLTESLMDTVTTYERGSPRKTQMRVSTCQLHPGKELEAYCMSHRILICWECAGREHRDHSCECMSAKEAVSKLQPEIDEMRTRLTKEVALAERLSRGDMEFANSRNRALDDINHLARKLDLFWQKMQEQISILRDDVEGYYSRQMNERRQFYRVAQTLLDSQCHLESLCENQSPTDILLNLPLLQEQVEENNIVIDAVMKESKRTEILLNVDPTLDDFLANFSALGHIDSRESGPREDERAEFLMEEREDNVLSSITESLEHILVPSVTDEGRQTGNIRFSGRLQGEDSCSLQGIAAFSDHSAGELYVLDLENGKLKKFNMVGDLQEELPLSGAPQGITATENPKFIAVTQPDKMIISFVSTSGRLRVRKCIKTMKSYTGISYLKPKSFVVTSSSRSCVDIIDHNGTPIKTFERDTDTRHRLFRRPEHVCVTNLGNIIVSKEDNKIICLDRSGKTKWTTRCPGDVSGLAIDRNDKIYACLRSSNSVIRVSPEGEVDSSHFLDSDEGLDHPTGAFVWGPFIVVVCRAGDIFVFEF